MNALKTGQGRYRVVVKVESFPRGCKDGVLIVIRAKNGPWYINQYTAVKDQIQPFWLGLKFF